MEPRSLNTILPLILAKSVSSLPRPTFRPGFTRVPRCRTMIVPPGTICPPNALNPSRCGFESRPFREVPCPFLCAMSQLSILKSIAVDSSADVPPAVARAFRPRRLFLLLRRGFLPRSFLGRSLLLGMSLGSLNFDFVLVLFRRGLLHLRLLLFQLRSLKTLPVKRNLRDAHSAERLPVPAQLLILLLALVVETQNLRSAAFFHEFADDPRSRLRPRNLSFATRHSQYLGKLHLAIGASGQLLHSNHIPGRHPVLFAAGADNRVHTFASVKISLKT